MNQRIYEELAGQFGVSVDEVTREMQAAIDASHIGRSGQSLTPDELIEHVVTKLLLDQN